MLYHSNVHLPKRIRATVPKYTVPVAYTQHAKSAAQTDRYGRLTLPDRIDLASAQLVECEHYDRKGLVKAVIRVQYNDTLDIVLVMIPGRPWLVKTVWANERGDNHRTLDATPYFHP